MAEKTHARSRTRAAKAGTNSPESPRAKSAAMKQYIAANLKAMYDEVAAEPLPKRLLELLDRLSNDKGK